MAENNEEITTTKSTFVDQNKRRGKPEVRRPKLSNGSKKKQRFLSAPLADAIATGSFVLLSSIFSEAAAVLAAWVGTSRVLAEFTVLVVGVLLHTPICGLLGGALYNPSHNVAFAVAGKGTPYGNFTRAVAQVVGGIGGSVAALWLIPQHWQRNFALFGQGVRPGVSVWAGMACEAALVFILNVCILWTMGFQNKYISFWTSLAATIVLVHTGSAYTGPSMNPAISFSWFVHFQGHDLYEHILVFWVSPFIGAYLAGLYWSRATGDSSKKIKEQ